MKGFTMKLTIKNTGNLSEFISNLDTSSWSEDKATSYDMKKLLEWDSIYESEIEKIDSAEKEEDLHILFSLAEEGYPEARRKLSDLYLQGHILERSLSKAVEWEYKANHAEQRLRYSNS